MNKVWRAVQITMSSYPIEKSDQETGIVKTKEIKGNLIWSPPFESKLPSGKRYKMTISLVQGKHKGKSVVRVHIEKDVTFKKNFFAETKDLESDYFEEHAILYKIQRELEIEQLLEKVNKKISKQ